MRTPQVARLKTAVGGGLTLDERRFVAALHPSRYERGKIMCVSQCTLEELSSPGGNLRPATLDRARARIAELQGTR